MAPPRRNDTFFILASPLVRAPPLLDDKQLDAERRSETGPGAQPIMRETRYGEAKPRLTSDGEADSMRLIRLRRCCFGSRAVTSRLAHPGPKSKQAIFLCVERSIIWRINRRDAEDAEVTQRS